MCLPISCRGSGRGEGGGRGRSWGRKERGGGGVEGYKEASALTDCASGSRHLGVLINSGNWFGLFSGIVSFSPGNSEQVTDSALGTWYVHGERCARNVTDSGACFGLKLVSIKILFYKVGLS